MTMKQNDDRPSSPAESAGWKKHLGKWKLFAAATGASMAASTDADADIVYSGAINKSITLYGNAESFGLAHVRARLTSLSHRSRIAYLSGRLDINMRLTGPDVLRKYAAGAPIGTSHLHNASYRTVAGWGMFRGTFGQFAPPANGTGTGFAGFQSQGHLGWIHLKITGNSVSSPTTFTIIDWAYNDAVGGGIYAGQMPAAAVPEPGTMAMGLLASGAAGLVALRKAKARAAATAEPAVA